MAEPKTISELIDAFGGATKFAEVIDKIPSTASEMKRSGSIRPRYWPKIIEAAAARGIEGVSPESLMQMHLNEEAAS
ncbi:carph-isopro domain-containing protein [Bradyrhizobium lablabi]|uniref:carph-isopro domain-containing protein n=1 Tax=Bradyrhizobium lablabi TaxID=722472 RepID=UPI001BA7CA3C|nr:hypothetical protein [Bradyrhizobium lablabi]MBR0693617.1 hypothetical protein [Bradyrhizobium lablabi]